MLNLFILMFITVLLIEIDFSLSKEDKKTELSLVISFLIAYIIIELIMTLMSTNYNPLFLLYLNKKLL